MTLTNKEEHSLLRQIEEFSNTHVAPIRDQLITSAIFPEEIWAAFSHSGLAGLGIPKEYGGMGASYAILSKAGYLLNRTGGVPGFTMTLMSHWLLPKLHIATNATDKIKQDLLPALAKGHGTLCVAISEPGAGAHPKFLKTCAERDGENFILNGEKTFLTNAPLAGYFIVLAITKQTEGQKEFSAILVPADSDGLERTAGAKLDFLHPCPHGGIRLKDCSVPLQNLIGEEGQAFERTSLQMRALEDAVGASAHVGCMERLLKDLANKFDSNASQKLGEIITQIQALKVTALHLAALTDNADTNIQDLMALHLGFRQHSVQCVQALKELSELVEGPLQPETTLLARDISKLQTIAKTAQEARLKKIGQAYLSS